MNQKKFTEIVASGNLDVVEKYVGDLTKARFKNEVTGEWVSTDEAIQILADTWNEIGIPWYQKLWMKLVKYIEKKNNMEK